MLSKESRERLYNKLILRCPWGIQLLFMERVIKGVRATTAQTANVTHVKKFGETMSEVWPKQAAQPVWTRRK